VFVIAVMVGERALAQGEGRSKRLAERAAAARALPVVDVESREEPP
jgi:dsRNA-specific ribonuclease